MLGFCAINFPYFYLHKITELFETGSNKTWFIDKLMTFELCTLISPSCHFIHATPPPPHYNLTRPRNHLSLSLRLTLPPSFHSIYLNGKKIDSNNFRSYGSSVIKLILTGKREMVSWIRMVLICHRSHWQRFFLIIMILRFFSGKIPSDESEQDKNHVISHFYLEFDIIILLLLNRKVQSGYIERKGKYPVFFATN